MGRRRLIVFTVLLGIAYTCTAYPRGSDSDSDSTESLSQQQQQNMDSESLEEFTQKIQSIKGRKKPEKVQVVEEPEPEPYDACLDSKKIGKCKARVPRYFFNKDTGNCELFPWGGCGKNGNNFRELTECESSCAKHLKPKPDVRGSTNHSSVIATCETPAVRDEDGPQCLAYIPRWTYNTSQQECVQFIWGGCDKTENNFATESLCQAKCGEYPNLKGYRGGAGTTTTIRPPRQQQTPKPKDKSVCDLPSEPGLCMAAFEKYFFNKINNRCELFTYGGCGGNGNVFDTPEDCVRLCGGDKPVQARECANVECPWALYDQYESLGCSAIYDGEACCPTRYECLPQQEVRNNTLDSRSLTSEKEDEAGTTTVGPEITPPHKCRYRGKLYKVGEMVDEASDGGSCRAGCFCSESNDDYGPKIVCAQMECPEHLQGRPRGKENCIPLYRRGACCSHDYHCPGGQLTVIDPAQREQPGGNKPPLVKCNLDGESYYEGERVYPNKSPCSKCLCEKNPANATSLEGQLHCEKVDCGIEIYYSHYLAQGCAPVYYEKGDGTTSCCPISWECPDNNQQESDSEDTASSTPEPMPKPPSTDSPPLSPSPPTPSDDTTEKPSSPLMRNREACTLEKMEGNCKGSRPSFYFNNDTQKCESFIYTGCSGNQNNFASLEDCKNLCESTSSLVAVQPSPPGKGAKTSGLLGRTLTIAHSPTSPQQGSTKAISLTEVDPCTLPKRVGRCKGYFPRFYYSPEENECKIFIFGGCRPNANNFYTKDSCQATCLNKIPVENLKTNVPTRLAIPMVERRMGSEGNGDSSRVNFDDGNKPLLTRTAILSPQPSSSSSEEGDPCTLPPRTGRCKAFVRKFYYDTDAKMCKHFTYGGCSGNANNFPTFEECDQQCGSHSTFSNNNAAEVPGSRGQGSSTPGATGESSSGAKASPQPSAVARCKLPKSDGACFSSIRSYYYDAETKSCKLFFYTGCFGNANRFISQADCENVCKKPLESEGGSTTSEGTINQPTQPQVHDLTGSTTEKSTDTEEESQEKAFCKEDPAPGNCRESQLRFYYDAVAEHCLPFVFSGCYGNKNNFVTETECMSSCSSKPTLEQLSDEMVLSCTFGNTTVPLGETVGQKEGSYLHEEPPCGVPVCQCITPPAVTCVQRMCPEPTTTTTTSAPPKVCPVPSCLRHCRIGVHPDDGCPTCDCDDSDRSGEIDVPGPDAPRLCPAPSCGRNCRAVFPEGSCPTCDCDGNRNIEATRAYRLCPSPSCLSTCRVVYPEGRCPTCDCDDRNRNTGGGFVDVQIPTKSVKG